MPLMTYEFKHDSVTDRRQLGSIGPGLEKIVPESVEVYAKSTYPSRNKVTDRTWLLVRLDMTAFDRMGDSRRTWRRAPRGLRRIAKDASKAV